MLGKIRINTNGEAIAKNWRVYLDDQDISKFVESISFGAAVGEITRIHLGLIGALELPEELEALIAASKSMPVVDITSMADEIHHFIPIKE